MCPVGPTTTQSARDPRYQSNSHHTAAQRVTMKLYLVIPRASRGSGCLIGIPNRNRSRMKRRATASSGPRTSIAKLASQSIQRIVRGLSCNCRPPTIDDCLLFVLSVPRDDEWFLNPSCRRRGLCLSKKNRFESRSEVIRVKILTIPW